MKQEVKVEGMTCEGCANTVKQRFAGIPEVENVEIDLENKKAHLDSTEKISNKKLQISLEGSNYSIAE